MVNSTGENNDFGQVKLEYFISEKQGFLVVSLAGAVTKGTSPTLESCYKEIAKREATCVVVSLHDVQRVEVGGIPSLVRLQQSIRNKPADLRVCFVSEDTMKLLTDAGAIRPLELATDLKEALQSFKARL